MKKRWRMLTKLAIVIGITGFIMFKIVDKDTIKVEATSLEDSNKVIQYIGTLNETLGSSLIIPQELKEDLVVRYNDEIKPILDKSDKYSEVRRDLQKIIHEVNNANETDGNYLVDTTPQHVISLAKQYAEIEMSLLNTMVKGVDIDKVVEFMDSTDAEKIEAIETILLNLNAEANKRLDAKDVEGFVKDLIKGLSTSSTDGSLEIEEVLGTIKTNETVQGVIKELQTIKEQTALDLGDETLSSYILTIDKILTNEKIE